MPEPIVTGIAVGLLTQVISKTGRWIATGVAKRSTSRRKQQEVSDFFAQYSLGDSLPILPDLPTGVDQERLGAILYSNEIQGIVHELLAVRLCDAPENSCARLKGGFATLLHARMPDASQLVGDLFSYFDKAAQDLAAALASAHPDVIHQMRSEAQFARINATLDAIQRHTASLSERGFPQSDRDFMQRYRRQLVDYHSKIEPPDFERRRRVPIDQLYVSPSLDVLSGNSSVAQTSLDGMIRDLDRTVLLGDPGGGKTTASHVVIYRHALDPSARVPFLVTLRKYAALDADRSIIRHIERNLESFYQCPPPAGFVDRTLLDGTGLVIFDGLDELIDTSRRAEVTTIVERFCREYPLSTVLVTSRTIGYDQARLDDSQFTCFRISGLSEELVREYVEKWFAQEQHFSAVEASKSASDFMSASKAVSDLRTNPLMLALMCILYRGQGSIPRSRPEVYEQCSNLLFHKWDARRSIHVDLRARNLVEPALRHLAYWLFSRESPEPAVTVRQLVRETTSFLRERGFENEHDAEAAAREFIDFCRGRAWVFNDAGTTAQGEELFTFTHRTFLEYFAAAQLSGICDTPEQLARKLIPRLARQEWDVVAQLALQNKDKNSDRGADRFFVTVLNERRRRNANARANIYAFLGRALDYVSISSARVRDLARKDCEVVFSNAQSGRELLLLPLGLLLENCYDYRDAVRDELISAVESYINGSDQWKKILGLRMITMSNRLISVKHSPTRSFWRDVDEDNFRRYIAEIWEMAEVDRCLALSLVGRQMMEISQYMSNNRGLSSLFDPVTIFRIADGSGYPTLSTPALYILGDYTDMPTRPYDLAWIKRQLSYVYEAIEHVGGIGQISSQISATRNWAGFSLNSGQIRIDMDEEQLAAAGFLLFGTVERVMDVNDIVKLNADSYLSVFLPFLRSRAGDRVELPTLNVPSAYQELFVGWAQGEVHLLVSPSADLIQRRKSG